MADTNTFALITHDGELTFEQGVPDQAYARVDPHGNAEGFTVAHPDRVDPGYRAYVGGISALRPEEFPFSPVGSAMATVMAAARGGRLQVDVHGNLALCGYVMLADGDIDVDGLTAEQQDEIRTAYDGVMSLMRGESPTVTSSPSSNEHDHDHFVIPPAERIDDKVDYDLMSAFLGAADETCTSCQDAELTRLVQDVPTTVQMVELNGNMIASMLGGLPAGMTVEDDPDELATHPPEFRAILRAALEAGHPDRARAAMRKVCEGMTETQRREAVNAAADGIIGMMTFGGPA